MATENQGQAAKRNVTKARGAAEKKRSIAYMPAKTRTALGKQGAAVALAQADREYEPQDPPGTL